MSEQGPVTPGRENASDGSFVERRQAQRFSCEGSPFWLGLEAEEGDGRARLINISATGLGLLTPSRIDPGRVVVVKLLSDTQGRSRPMPARIIHSTLQPDGSWLSGGAFVRRLSDEDLAAILREARQQG